MGSLCRGVRGKSGPGERAKIEGGVTIGVLGGEVESFGSRAEALGRS